MVTSISDTNGNVLVSGKWQAFLPFKSNLFVFYSRHILYFISNVSVFKLILSLLLYCIESARLNTHLDICPASEATQFMTGSPGCVAQVKDGR